MFKIGRNIKINTSDTQINVNSRNGYLPGGTMSIVWNNVADLVLQSRNEETRKMELNCNWKRRTIN